jgi:hypothetical protein
VAGTAPVWLLVVLMLAMGIGGPVSMVGFDFVRSFNPAAGWAARPASSTRGLFASLLVIVAIGVVLDWRAHPGRAPTTQPADFAWAMATSTVAWAVGLSQIWRYRRQTRRELAANDPERYASLRAGHAALR